MTFVCIVLYCVVTVDNARLWQTNTRWCKEQQNVCVYVFISVCLLKWNTNWSIVATSNNIISIAKKRVVISGKFYWKYLLFFRGIWQMVWIFELYVWSAELNEELRIDPSYTTDYFGLEIFYILDSVTVMRSLINCYE